VVVLFFLVCAAAMVLYGRGRRKGAILVVVLDLKRMGILVVIAH